jgi:hypothetical protein
MKQLYILFFLVLFSVSLSVIANNPPHVNLSDSMIDLGYKKISKKIYLELVAKNEAAKLQYAKLQTHNKLLESNNTQSTDYSLYKIIELKYDAKKIRFNSLFVKTIIENTKIKLVHFSPTEALIYSDKDFDVVKFNTILNDISLTPINTTVK